jgi:hypothetical protein
MAHPAAASRAVVSERDLRVGWVQQHGALRRGLVTRASVLGVEYL